MKRSTSKCSVSATLLINPGENEIEVAITGDYWPATPDVRYLPNGDPGYPGCDEYVDDLRAFHEGKPFELSGADEKRAKDIIIETACEG